MLACVQSTEKLSSPVGSLMEGLNKDPPSSESTLSTRVSSVPAADTQGSAEGNTAAQFRSPLLRQMMGNKVVAGGRPTSATNDDVLSAANDGDVMESVSRDDATAEETKEISTAQSHHSSIGAELSAGNDSDLTSATNDVASDVTKSTAEETKDISATQSDQLSIGAELSATNDSTFIKDEIAVCDEPLDPSPRVSAPVSHTSLGQDDSTTLRPIPIEVWTEESTIPASSSQSYNDRDDKAELCIEDQPLDPSPRSEVNTCGFDRPDKCTSDSKPDLSSSRADHSGIDDRDEPCVEDTVPLEPSPSCSVDGRAASFDYFRSQLIDANNGLHLTVHQTIGLTDY